MVYCTKQVARRVLVENLLIFSSAIPLASHPIYRQGSFLTHRNFFDVRALSACIGSAAHQMYFLVHMREC